ncbi:MAG: F0F1 ATP synthase subunit delta [Minisyncoccales bacterium]
MRERPLFMNSKKAIKIWTAALVKECSGKSAGEQKKIILRLKEILGAQKRDYLLAKIVSSALEEMKKRAKFEITFAREHDLTMRARLEKKLAECLGASEDADIKINPSIIGGFVAATDGYRMDASIKGQIEKLKKLKM